MEHNRFVFVEKKLNLMKITILKISFKNFSLLFILFFSLLKLDAAPQAKEGVLDLRMWDGISTYSLDGEWIFFWNTFINAKDVFEDIKSQKFDIESVPSYWSDYEIEGEPLPGDGYCSYALTVLLPKGLKNKLALDIPIFDDSYELFLNGQSVSQNGVPGISQETSEPGYKPKLLIFEANMDKLEIVIHVANFAHRRGGFWKSIRIGDADKFIHQKNIYELVAHATLGLIGAFTLFFLFFFIFYPKNIKALFFSLMLAGILLRLIATDTFPALVFGQIPWDWLVRFEYLGSFIALVFASWYFLTIYPDKRMRIAIMMNSVIIGLICIFIVILKPAYFAYTMFYFKPLVVLFFAYYFVISFRHIFKRNDGDEYYFATILILFIFLVNDLRVSSSSTSLFNDYSIAFSIQLFIIIHGILAIKSWVKAFKEKEKLNLEIEYMNLHLERRIEDRIQEISESKERIKKQNEEIRLKNEDLKSTINFSNKIQSIISHDLRSPIVSIYQISDYFSFSDKQEGMRETIKSIRELSWSANSLIDNLLFWGRSQQGGLHFSPEIIRIQDLISETLTLSKIALKQKSVDVDVLITEGLEVYGDSNLLMIIFRNLISNAIKFSNKNTIITISAASPKNSANVIIVIEDKGIGIPPAILKDLNNKLKETVEIRKGT